MFENVPRDVSVTLHLAAESDRGISELESVVSHRTHGSLLRNVFGACHGNNFLKLIHL